MLSPTRRAVSNYRAEMIQRDQDSGGKLGFARLSPGEQTIRYRQKIVGRGEVMQNGRNLSANLYAGFGDIATQVPGRQRGVTGNEDLSNLAVENQRNMESVLTGQQYGGPRGLPLAL